MVLQKQKLRPWYTKSGNILIIGLLVLIFVVRFGILIQKSENDILSLSSQIKSEAEQIRQKTHVRVQRSTVQTTDINTGLYLGSGTNSTGNK